MRRYFLKPALWIALVLIAIVLSMNAVSIAFRMYLRSKKKW